VNDRSSETLIAGSCCLPILIIRSYTKHYVLNGPMTVFTCCACLYAYNALPATPPKELVRKGVQTSDTGVGTVVDK